MEESCVFFMFGAKLSTIPNDSCMIQLPPQKLCQPTPTAILKWLKHHIKLMAYTKWSELANQNLSWNIWMKK